MNEEIRQVAFQRLMKDNISVNAYKNNTPKKSKYPLVSYRHVAHSAARLLSGEKSGKSDTWQISIHTKDDEDMDTLVKEVEQLHNLKNKDYQRVFGTLGNIVTKEDDETVSTTIITLQTFLRG